MPLPPSSTWNTHYKYPLISMIHIDCIPNQIGFERSFLRRPWTPVSEGVGAYLFVSYPPKAAGRDDWVPFPTIKENIGSAPVAWASSFRSGCAIVTNFPNSSARVTCEGIRSGAIVAARVVGEPRVHLRWQVTTLLEEFTSTEMTSEKSS